jgi:hypothetical protein
MEVVVVVILVATGAGALLPQLPVKLLPETCGNFVIQNSRFANS